MPPWADEVFPEWPMCAKRRDGRGNGSEISYGLACHMRPWLADEHSQPLVRGVWLSCEDDNVIETNRSNAPLMCECSGLLARTPWAIQVTFLCVNWMMPGGAMCVELEY